MRVQKLGSLGALVAATAAVAAGCGGSAQQAASTSNTSTASAANQTTTDAATTPAKSSPITRVAPANRHVGRHSADRRSTTTEAQATGTAAAANSGPRTGAGPARIKTPSPAGTVNSPTPPTTGAGDLAARFSGSGSKAIGTISEKQGVVLEWATASPGLQIFNAHGFLLVNSELLHGQVRLASGQYGNVHVAGKGPWTVQIHATA